ncbi:hypothetical protein LXL04_009496 [Taraxacum kok-saghyz]
MAPQCLVPESCAFNHSFLYFLNPPASKSLLIFFHQQATLLLSQWRSSVRKSSTSWFSGDVDSTLTMRNVEPVRYKHLFYIDDNDDDFKDVRKTTIRYFNILSLDSHECLQPTVLLKGLYYGLPDNKKPQQKSDGFPLDIRLPLKHIVSTELRVEIQKFLQNVATISSNGEREIGELIARGMEKAPPSSSAVNIDGAESKRPCLSAETPKSRPLDALFECDVSSDALLTLPVDPFLSAIVSVPASTATTLSPVKVVREKDTEPFCVRFMDTYSYSGGEPGLIGSGDCRESRTLFLVVYVWSMSGLAAHTFETREEDDVALAS